MIEGTPQQWAGVVGDAQIVDETRFVGKPILHGSTCAIGHLGERRLQPGHRFDRTPGVIVGGRLHGDSFAAIELNEHDRRQQHHCDGDGDHEPHSRRLSTLSVLE